MSYWLFASIYTKLKNTKSISQFTLIWPEKDADFLEKSCLTKDVDRYLGDNHNLAIKISNTCNSPIF